MSRHVYIQFRNKVYSEKTKRMKQYNRMLFVEIYSEYNTSFLVTSN